MKKKSVVIIFALAVVVLTSIAPAAYAGGSAAKETGKADSKGSKSVVAAIEAAVPRAFAVIDAELPAKLKSNAAIAIFPVSAASADHGEMVLEKITTQFVNSNKYTVVEKRRVEELLAEYDFQKSGMVGEKTLGELLGADAVIFSALTNDGKLNSWAVDTAKCTTLAKSLNGTEVTLPTVTGGSNNEAETIASFITHNNYMRTNSHAMVQEIGRKKVLLLGISEIKKSGSVSSSLNYADALELWVKLHYTPPVSRSTAARSVHIWSQFGAGVNRAEAETLTQVLIADTLSIPYDSARLTSFLDYTLGYETAMQTIPQTVRHEGVDLKNPGTLALQWREYVKTPQFTAGTDNRDARYGFNALRKHATISDIDQPFYFDWSRRGNKTRLDAGQALRFVDGRYLYFKYSIEYGSQQEFLTKMRGLSLFILTTAASHNGDDERILGLDGYDLSTAVAPAPIPANFFKLNRISSQAGAAPMGGFYFAEAPITQREFETLMKKNPSAVKNPAQPVTNVSMVDAMIYCNQLSIRDGLEPAYLIEYVDRSARGYSLVGVFRYNDEGIKNINIDNFANGYRLPTAEEWQYAYKQMSARKGGVNTAASEYVFNGKFSEMGGWSRQTMGIKLGDAIAYLPDENKFETVQLPRHEGTREYDVARPVKPYEQDLGAVEFKDTFRTDSDGKRIPVMGNKVRVSPGIRLVRPIFDYWKYTSGQ
jgi:hypothetical protein